MRSRHWLAMMCAAALLLAVLPPRALGQYATGLPPGVVAAEVDGQPIDAVNTPQTGNPSPVIAGRINTGQPVVDIGIGNGDILRFQAEVDAKGRFKSKPPAPLAPGQYGLYLFDTLVGAFVVSGDGAADAGAGRKDRQSAADSARMVPFPADFYGVYPGLGLLDGRYYTADEEASRTAAATGDTSPEAVARARAGLRDAGWVQRYESRFAVPYPDDSTRFAVQATSSVIEYEDEARAIAAFGATLTGADLRPDIAVGMQSELTRVEGVTPDTGTGYVALRNVFQYGRFVCVTVLADLSGGEPDQDAILSAALATANRVAEVDAGVVAGSAPKALRLALTNGTSATIDESYQAIDGQLVPLYDEPQGSLAARQAAFSGTYEDFVGGVSGRTEAGGGQDFAFGSTISSFPSAGDADLWLSNLPGLVASDKLPGYSAFDPVSAAGPFGEASAVYSVTRTVGEAQLEGFRVYTRVGADVAIVEFASSAAPAIDDLLPLIDAQVACLPAGACAGPADLPIAKPGRGGGNGQTAAETPEPGASADAGVDATTPAATR
ncbi:MAG: hypothetical protein ACKOWF_08245, partial [Chloroflexota bacterium]